MGNPPRARTPALPTSRPASGTVLNRLFQAALLVGIVLSGTSTIRENVQRLGLAYRINDDTVFRAGYGKTFNPMPWSRPIRGFYPATIAYSDAGPNGFTPYGNLADGIPGAPNPDIQSGNIPLPRGVDMRSPDPDDVKRGHTDSWNAFIERRLPLGIATSIGYVGTRTDGGYADLNINYGQPGGGNASRQYFNVAGTTAINDWAARTKSRYNSLQLSAERRYSGPVGQTFENAVNVDWPRSEMANYTRTINWETGTSKETFDRKPGESPASWKYGLGWRGGTSAIIRLACADRGDALVNRNLETLRRLRTAGLDSIPGGGAEVGAANPHRPLGGLPGSVGVVRARSSAVTGSPPRRTSSMSVVSPAVIGKPKVSPRARSGTMPSSTSS